MTNLSPPIPVFRIFDEAKAREFYVDYLGFTIDWVHRFEPELPIYMSVSRGSLTLHLSEHHGDGCPGSAARVEVDDIETLHNELLAKDYHKIRPGIEHKPWNTREISVTDPFHNRLAFYEPLEKNEDTEVLDV